MSDSGKIDELKGRAKEAAGAATDDDKLRDEGRKDQAQGKLRQAGEKVKDDPFAKVRVAEAASDIDAAWRQLIGNVSDEYSLLEAGKEIPFSLRACARRDQVRATGRAIASIDRLFEASGATALQNDAPVQRFWRDAHAGRVHAANDPERAYLIFGNDAFGLPPQDTMV